MASRNIEVVLFDLDDTLHDDTASFTQAAHRAAADVAAEHKIDAAALADAYIEEAFAFWGELTAAQLNRRVANIRQQLWAKALARLGIVDDGLAERCARAFNTYRREYLTVFPGVLELLRSLRDDGKRIGLVTNGFAETHHEKITLLKIRDFFDAIFVADEIGMVKPDPRLFTHACTVLGASPRESAMVGDRYERDILGAIEAGLFTIWVNVRGEELPAGALPPNAVCDSVLEVRRILESASAIAAQGS